MHDAFATRVVHAGAEPDETTGAVSPPIYQTSTYAQDGVGRPRGGYEYARSQNPTRERLERAVADLEGGRHGIAFASGSATTAAIAQLAAEGDEIVVGDDVYGGTYRYFERVHRPAGAGEARYVDLAAGPDALWEALTEQTRLVWFETPSNPHAQGHRRRGLGRARPRSRRPGGPAPAADRRRQHVRLARPPAAARAGRRRRVPLGDQVPGRPLGRDPRASPSRPTTRSPSGCGSCRTRWAGSRGRSTASWCCAASAPSPCAWSATAPTRWPSPGSWPARDDVAWVGYPGLGEGRHAHPGHETAARQMRLGGQPAFGGMVSFMPADGGRARAQRRRAGRAVCEATRLFTLAESLGSVESLIEVPAAMTHLSVTESALAVDPALVRLSVGIEAAEDLIADLAQALDEA